MVETNMNKHSIFLTIAILLARAATAMAQQAVPPRPPAPRPAAPAPSPRPAPLPPRAPWDDEVRAQIDSLRFEIDTEAIRESVRSQLEGVRSQLADVDGLQEAVRAQVEGSVEMALAGIPGGLAGPFKLAPQIALKPQTALRGRDSGDRAYERGQRALDKREWDAALQAFTQVAGSGGSRADGALYWKAYALAKLGRRDDAVAAIAELRKSYASSRWLEDAGALELELKQASGQRVTPESENDEDLKLMALNGLVQSDPERAIPLLENLLKTSSSPRLKERALFVLAQSNAPRGRQLLEQVARGGAGNPDLQLKAISYISATNKRQQTGNPQLLWEIYSGSNDNQVKRAALRGLMASRDKDHLLQVARTEKATPLRLEAISFLGSSGAQTELWQIYQGETAVDVKRQILHAMIAGGSTDRLLEVAKTEKDPDLRRTAIQALGSMHTTATGDALVSLYTSEPDPAVRRAIVDSLHSERNAKALVDLARKENDPAMKREIVGRLSRMKSKEAADYLMELLK